MSQRKRIAENLLSGLLRKVADEVRGVGVHNQDTYPEDIEKAQELLRLAKRVRDLIADGEYLEAIAVATEEGEGNE